MNRPRRLTRQDRTLVEEFLSPKLDLYVFVAERMLGHFNDDVMALGIENQSGIESMLLLSGNAVPISINSQTAPLYANTSYVKYAQIASIVGVKKDVNAFWAALSESDTTRQIASLRDCQPYLLLDSPITSDSQAHLEYIALEDFEQFFDASYSMFHGEVGRAPLNIDSYRSRLYEQVLDKRSIGYIDDDGVLRFKVDVPIVYNSTCQVQGVWMHPQWRGQGKSVELFSVALAMIQRDIASRITLYVNDFNLPALKLYQRLGFKQIEEYSTIFLDM